MLSNDTASSRVHIYCRVSSVGQEDNTSLASQESACRAWANEHGVPVASVAREVWSGGDRHRPELDALLDRLLPGDVLLSYDLDRLSRGGQIDTAVIIDRVESAGARVAFVTLDFEQSETGALLRNVRAFAAALEREKIAERTSRGKRARVASGKPLVGRKAPYGYRWNVDKTGYILEPDEARVVRLIFDLALASVSLREIVKRLADLGIPSPTGKPRWSFSSLRDILRRTVYTGTVSAYAIRYERRPTGRYGRRAAVVEDVVALPDVAPTIVTPEEQAAVVARLAANKEHAARNNRNPEAALLRAGFLVCGHCGAPLRVVHRPVALSGSSPQYRCENRQGACPRPTITASLLDGNV
jgi:site-specific DNA recombinase